MPYSYDLRLRVVSAVESGLSVEEASKRFEVSARTIFDWLKIKRETGDIQQREGCPGRKRKLESLRPEIEQLINEHSAITLEEIKAQLKLTCVVATIWYALSRWGITLKKSHQGQRTATA